LAWTDRTARALFFRCLAGDSTSAAKGISLRADRRRPSPRALAEQRRSKPWSVAPQLPPGLFPFQSGPSSALRTCRGRSLWSRYATQGLALDGVEPCFACRNPVATFFSSPLICAAMNEDRPPGPASPPIKLLAVCFSSPRDTSRTGRPPPGDPPLIGDPKS